MWMPTPHKALWSCSGWSVPAAGWLEDGAFAALEELDLSYNPGFDGPLPLFGSSDAAQGLQVLELEGCAFTGEMA